MLTSPLTRFFGQLFPGVREAEEDWRRARSPRAALACPSNPFRASFVVVSQSGSQLRLLWKRQ
jgi:hypothetical protein